MLLFPWPPVRKYACNTLCFFPKHLHTFCVIPAFQKPKLHLLKSHTPAFFFFPAHLCLQTDVAVPMHSGNTAVMVLISPPRLKPSHPDLGRAPPCGPQAKGEADRRQQRCQRQRHRVTEPGTPSFYAFKLAIHDPATPSFLAKAKARACSTCSVLVSLK